MLEMNLSIKDLSSLLHVPGVHEAQGVDQPARDDTQNIYTCTRKTISLRMLRGILFIPTGKYRITCPNSRQKYLMTTSVHV